MRAALFNGPHAIEVGERPDPVISLLRIGKAVSR